jgi:hypothetical protein
MIFLPCFVDALFHKFESLLQPQIALVLLAQALRGVDALAHFEIGQLPEPAMRGVVAGGAGRYQTDPQAPQRIDISGRLLRFSECGLHAYPSPPEFRLYRSVRIENSQPSVVCPCSRVLGRTCSQ